MNRHALTLLELLVVLAVMSLVVGAVPVILSGGLTGISLKAEAREVGDVFDGDRYFLVVDAFLRELGWIPEGTSRPVTALINIFSAPCGYFTFNG